MAEDREQQYREMWADYRKQMQALIEPSRDLRTQQRELRNLSDEDLTQRLRDRQVNDRGVRQVLEERFLRSEIRRHSKYGDVPWYPEFDEIGGAMMPFVELGMLSDLKERAQLKAQRQKRGPKPQTTESSGAEVEVEEETDDGVETRDQREPLTVPTALSFTSTTTTITVTTMSRPINHPGIMSSFQPPQDVRTTQLDGAASTQLMDQWLRAGIEAPLLNVSSQNIFTPYVSPNSTVLTPQHSRGTIPKSRISQLPGISEGNLDTTVETGDFSRRQEESSGQKRPIPVIPLEQTTSEYEGYVEEKKQEKGKPNKERQRRLTADDETRNDDKKTEKEKKNKHRRRRESTSDSSESDDESDETSSSQNSEEDSSQSEESSESTGDSSSSDESSEDERRRRRRKQRKNRENQARKEKKERKKRQRRKAERRRKKEVRAATVLDILNKWKLKFSGEKKENADNFICRLDDCKQTNQISGDDLLTALPGVLDEAAGQWYRVNRREIDTWSQFKKAFKQKYVVELKKEDVWRELRARTQTKGEDIRTFVSNIKCIIGHLRKPPPLRKQLKIARDNLLPEYRRYLLDKEIDDFHTLEKYGKQLERQKELDHRNAHTSMKEKSKIPESVFETTAKNIKIAAVDVKDSETSSEEEVVVRKKKSSQKRKKSSKKKEKSAVPPLADSTRPPESAAVQVAPTPAPRQFEERPREAFVPQGRFSSQPSSQPSSQSSGQRPGWQSRNNRQPYQQQNTMQQNGQSSYRPRPAGWTQPTAFLGVCFNCQDVGHRAAECPQAQCFVCHQTGHRAATCPSRQSTQPRDRCQVCDRQGCVFKTCPNCQQFREMMENGAAGAQFSPLPPASTP